MLRVSLRCRAPRRPEQAARPRRPSRSSNRGSRVCRLRARSRRERSAGSRTEGVWGTVSGVVAPRDTIYGFDQLPHDADGNYDYQSEFEIIAPEKPGTNSVIVVEAENRGRPVFLNALHEVEMAGPPSATTNGGDPGNGFLFRAWDILRAGAVANRDRRERPDASRGRGRSHHPRLWPHARRAHATGRQTVRGFRNRTIR